MRRGQVFIYLNEYKQERSGRKIPQIVCMWK